MGASAPTNGVLLIWGVMLLGISHPAACVFSTANDIQAALHAEGDLATLIDRYVDKEHSRLRKLKDISQDLRQHSVESLADPYKKIGNLVSAFLTVKHFTVDFSNIMENYVKNSPNNEMLDEMVRVAGVFPGNDELQSTAAALLRLQDTYDLTPATMAHGEIEGVHTEDIMTAGDCFELGKLAYDRNDFYHAIAWMEHALNESKFDKTETVDKLALYDYLNFAYFKEDDIQRAHDLTVEWLSLDPEAERAAQNLEHYKNALANDEDQIHSGDPVSPKHSHHPIERQRSSWQQEQVFYNYESLCRGEDLLDLFNETVRKDLFCSLQRHHPFFYIAPLKEEVLYLAPRVVIYHNILSETEMAKIKEMAAPNLYRSGVFTNEEKTDPFSEQRTSRTCWIQDYEHKMIKRVSEKSSAAANLSLSTVEDLQVVSYGIGGHYEPHYDFSKGEENSGFKEGAGNRIATAIFYLADVEAGGSTVFPAIGVKVKPEKGSLVVWYNLHRNGDPDYRTLHAACPVLTGSKWIATKWFHEANQEFKRKCSLDPNE